jgi:molybdopterin biosynthesis enzyme
MLQLEEARKRILAAVRELPSERVSPANAVRRIVANRHRRLSCPACLR